MKKYVVLFLASVFGSIVTISTFKLIDTGKTNSLKIEHISSTPIVGATYTVNSKGEIVPLDFTEVAKKVMPAVVHIKSTQLENVNLYKERRCCEKLSMTSRD